MYARVAAGWVRRGQLAWAVPPTGCSGVVDLTIYARVHELTCPLNWAHDLHDCRALGGAGELIRARAAAEEEEGGGRTGTAAVYAVDAASEPACAESPLT